MAAFLINNNNRVTLLSSKPACFDGTIQYIDNNTKKTFEVKGCRVTDDYEEIVKGKEMIFITLPTFMIKETVEKIIDYLDENVPVGFCPGAGGIEHLAKEFIDKNITFFGFDRVPFVARIKEYGKCVEASIKKKVRIASIPRDKNVEIAKRLRDLFPMEIGVLDNFLNITLTPTLHIARIFDLFGEVDKNYIYKRNILFYKEWSDNASELCFKLDEELHKVCDFLVEEGISLKDVIPYPIHYESPTPKMLTYKLRNISSLETIKSPMIEVRKEEWIIDWASRYFTESIPYRLCIVKGLALLCGVPVKMTDTVLQWYERMSGKQYFFFENNTCKLGKDIYESTAPQVYGINSVQDIKSFYEK